MDIYTEECYICGKKLPAEAMEPIFTGRRHFICEECKKQCSKEAIGHRASYFRSYQGKKRKEFSDKKRRG